MSARYRFRHLADIEPLWFTDIGPTSSLYRPDVGLISLTTSGRHRAHVQTWSRPDIASMSARCRPGIISDIWPTSGLRFSDIGPTSSLYRPDVGLISLTTSGRHRAHVQTWSRPDISRHLPISGRYNFRYQADVLADISRYQADIRPIVFCYLG